MGWFSSDKKDEGGPAKTSGGAFESPTRSTRKQCYGARDAFFECLDKNNLLDSINTKTGREKAQTFCAELDQEFEKNCAHSWVSEFHSWWGNCISKMRTCMSSTISRIDRSGKLSDPSIRVSAPAPFASMNMRAALTSPRSSTLRNSEWSITKESRRSRGSSLKAARSPLHNFLSQAQSDRGIT
jgi:cytochrome c oxidase assembly factor 6